jgi:hypothetical protein
MAHLKDIEKYHTRRCFSSDKEYFSLFRLLFCRLMDVNDKFPGKINGLVAIEDYFRDFLLFDESENNYRFFKCNDYYRIEIEDEYNCTENIRFPKCILDANWEEELKKFLYDDRRKKLQTEIERIKQFMKTAPDELKKLEMELSELNKECV